MRFSRSLEMLPGVPLSVHIDTLGEAILEAGHSNRMLVAEANRLSAFATAIRAMAAQIEDQRAEAMKPPRAVKTGNIVKFPQNAITTKQRRTLEKNT